MQDESMLSNELMYLDDEDMIIRPDWDDPAFIAELLCERRRECAKDDFTESPSSAQLLPGLIMMKDLLDRAVRKGVRTTGADRLCQQAVVSHGTNGRTTYCA